ncbi:amino acid permease [Loigolactobacillus backii]|uniref:amino acid permease n=1 Tax=Loigolactobacillus backii TaxID=375175 RepID=UPI0007F0D36F|nr:amino acid permease [Loigolactobacillus backii]ANK66694.1 D-alanine/D-serine/glycine permease [Loigolactobacillus backii]OLF70146.1 D-alanine/D-serine/glycine permease [Loigolactobacillus backii]PIO87411.1 amino acid permease [Loigolactobacillus backii]
MSEKQTGETQGLARNLKSRHVQLIAIGGTIGTGLFLGAGKSIHLAGPSILFAYLLTGIVCFMLMRALGELLLSDLNLHSFVDFIKEYLGESAGFIAGWTYWICWVTIAMAEVTATGLYMKFWFPSLPQWLPGLLMLIILLGVNLITVGAFGEVEFWFALIKIVAIIALIAVGIFMVIVGYKTPTGQASLSNLTNYGGIFPTGAKGFILSFQMVVFSFIGIEMVGMTASETQNPEKLLPKAINDIPLRIILFYVGALFVIMCIYPWSHLSASQSPFVQVFKNIGIRSAAGIVNFVVITASASACNSSLFSTGRMLFSLAYDSDNRFLHHFGKLSKSRVPASALLFSTVVIAFAVLLNLFIPNIVFTLVSSVATTCFLFIWGAIIVTHLRYRKTKLAAASTFKAPWQPFADYFVLAFLVFVAVVLCLEKSTLIALIISVIWFAGLYLVRFSHDRHRATGKRVK